MSVSKIKPSPDWEPSPAEIEAECKLIRASWTKERWADQGPRNPEVTLRSLHDGLMSGERFDSRHGDGD